MQSKKAYELVTTGKPDDPAFPHAMVLTVSFVIFPVIGLDCHRRFACAKLDASVEASEPHDFAVRVQHRSSAAPHSVHRIPPRVRDDRERPSVGRDGAIKQVFCLAKERKYFCDCRWTGDLPVGHRALWRGRPCARQPSLRAQRSNPALNDPAGLLRRCAPRNDELRYRGMTTNARTQPSLRAERSNPALNHKAGLLRRVAPSANAARLSQAMTESREACSSVFAKTRASPFERTGVLLLAHLFHPLDRTAVQCFLDGDMRHGGGGRGAVPVLLPRREPDDIARPDLLDGIAKALRPTQTRGDDQGLAKRVGVPGCTSARLERHARAPNARGVRGFKQRINPHGAREIISRPFTRRS